jgi:Tfp pilus assembly protein FimV
VARRSARAWGARLAAPAAFLLAVTIAFLLVRAALRDADDASKTVPVSTAAAATRPATRTTTPARTARPRARATKPQTRFYVIQSGDTFGTVAAQFDTTVAALQALNPDVSSNALVIGQRIRVR